MPTRLLAPRRCRMKGWFLLDSMRITHHALATMHARIAGCSVHTAVDIVPFDVDNFPAKLVRQRAADLRLDIITEIGMPAHANIISPDPAIRAAGTELTKRLVDLSVGAGSLVVGGGHFCWLG